MSNFDHAVPGYKILSRIYESASSFVFRAVRESDGQPVVLKMLKPDTPNLIELNRYKQEYQIIRNLKMEHVIKAYTLEPYEKSLVIVLEDFGGESLEILSDRRLSAGQGLLPIDEFIDIAARIAQGLTNIHASHVIHQNINPSNIVYNPTTGQLKIIDFRISTALTREYPTVQNPNRLEGSLAYISPEQTGRMNRSLDYRTDLYSLGVTLYEMLTDHLPFEGDDPLALVHAHMAKTPRAVTTLNPDVPPIVSDVVMKLLAKNAEDRYQSAFGLKADLERCRDALKALPGSEGLPDLRFELGTDDYTEAQHQDISTSVGVAPIVRSSATGQGTPASLLDMASLLKANQTLSQTVQLSDLLAQMMKILVENTGAEKAFILYQTGEDWFIEAGGEVEDQVIETQIHLPITETAKLSQSVCNFVIHSGQTVVLANAVEDPQFAADAYLQEQAVKSVLCLPIWHKGVFKLVLYLENNLAEGAFTERHLELLQLLSGQMAISLENALMVDSLKTSIDERKRTEKDLRESEKRLSVIFNNSSDLQLLVNVEPDRSFRIVSVNQTYLNTVRRYGFDITEQDLVGRTINEIVLDVFGFDQAILDYVLKHYRLAVDTGVPVCFEEYLNLEPNPFYSEVTIVPVIDGTDTCRYVLWTSHDITERKRVEEALRESENRLSVIFNNSSDFQLLISVEPDGSFRIASVNQSYLNNAQNYGFDISEQNLVGKTINEVGQNVFGFDQATVDYTLRYYRQTVETVAPVRYEEYFDFGPRRLYSEVTMVPVIDGTDTCRYVLWTSHDITERKRAEDALKESEERLRVALEGTTDGIWDWDPRTDQTYFSPRYYTMMGYEPDEFPPVYESWRQLVHPDDLQAADKVVQRSLEEHTPFAIEFRFKAKNGEWRWILGRGKVVELDAEGKAARVAGSHTDITERKRMEDALEKRILALTQPLDAAEGIAFEDLFNLSDMQHLQDLSAEAFGVAALITHPDGTPITQPSNFTDLCDGIIRKTAEGIRRCNYSDSMIGRHNPSGPNIQPCLSAGLCNAGASITVGGRHIANWLIGQVRNEEDIVKYAREIGADEGAFRAAYSKVPVMSQEQFDRAAQVIFTMANQISMSAYQNVQQARFIADRKRAEKELARHRDHLEELVQERTRELEAVQEQLLKKERLAVLGQLTATVSHELRNPLGVVRSSAFYLQRKLSKADEKTFKHLTRIDEQVSICNDIVEDLLEYTRGRQSQKIIGKLNQWLQKLLDDFTGAKEIKVEHQLSEVLPPVSFDQEKMRRVVINLVNNARQAVHAKKEQAAGEGTSYDPKITLSTRLKHGLVVIQVEDNGMGMDEKTATRAFEPLFTTRARGTGLGLAIVEKTVVEHGGTVTLESRPNEGTCVKVVLPISVEP
jgi:PAS domain S-box-containing protein